MIIKLKYEVFINKNNIFVANSEELKYKSFENLENYAKPGKLATLKFWNAGAYENRFRKNHIQNDWENLGSLWSFSQAVKFS